MTFQHFGHVARDLPLSCPVRYEGLVAEVFLSYARENAGDARRVAAELRRLGISVWWDEDLPAHRPYSDVIGERLAAAAAVIVLWSQEASRSHWVRAEADAARNRGVLVQATLDDSLPPLPFNQYHSPSLNSWTGEAAHLGWSAVVASVSSLIEGSDPSQIATSPAAGSKSDTGGDAGVKRLLSRMIDDFSLTEVAAFVEAAGGNRRPVRAVLFLTMCLLTYGVVAGVIVFLKFGAKLLGLWY